MQTASGQAALDEAGTVTHRKDDEPRAELSYYSCPVVSKPPQEEIGLPFACATQGPGTFFMLSKGGFVARRTLSPSPGLF